MARVDENIRISNIFVNSESGYAWTAGGAGERLVMFAQLKEWAETEFDIKSWFHSEIPSY